MYLTKEEEAMLKGDEGEGVRRCMELLVKTGEFMGAKDMVPIVFAAAFKPENIWRPEAWEDECRQLGAKYRVRNGFEYQPLFGEHGEYTHTAAATLNSLYGARCNAVGDAYAFAAAVTGRAANCGFHLKENRYGRVLVKVEGDLGNDPLNWEAAGYVISTRLEGDWTKVPVITGLPYNYLNRELMGRLTSGLVTATGPIVMFHVPGRTPEAPTLEAAFGPNKAEETISIEMHDVNNEINMWTAGEGEIDAVYVSEEYGGASVEGIEKWSTPIKGRKVHEGVLAFMGLSAAWQLLPNLEAASLNKMVKDAGFITSVDEYVKRLYGRGLGEGAVYGSRPKINGKLVELPIKRLVTNNFFTANYSTDIDCMLRPADQCIEAALTGKVKAWRR